MVSFDVLALVFPCPCSSLFRFFWIGLLGFSVNQCAGLLHRSLLLLKLTCSTWLTLSTSHVSSVVFGLSVALRVIPGLSHAHTVMAHISAAELCFVLLQ